MMSPSELRDFRIDCGLTQREVGLLYGCTQQAVAHWEQGLFAPGASFYRDVVPKMETISSARHIYFAVREAMGLR